MLPTLIGMSAKALLPSKKKIDKDKVFDRKKSSAIQKVDSERGIVNQPVIRKKSISTDLFLPPAKSGQLAVVDKKVSGGSLKKLFDDISGTLNDIIDTLKNKQSSSQANKRNKRKGDQLEERKEREAKLEKRKRKQFELKPNLPGDKFNIMKFFENILIGSIVLAIFKNLEKIVNFFEGLYNQFKNFITKLGEVLSPVWNGLKWIASGGANIIAKILGVPSQEADTNGLKKNLEEITKKIPIIGDLFKGIKNTIDSIRVYKEPTEPRGAGPSSYTAGIIPQAVKQDVQFTQGVTQLAKKYDVPEDYLYAIMGFETGGTFDPAKRNIAGSGATGLIQFMPSTARGLGTTTDALSRMSRSEQLKYVDKYFASKDIKGGTLSDLYMAVLLPAAVGKPEDFVLFGLGGAYGGQRAYQQNKGLDLNKDGKITKAEAAAKVQAYLPKGFSSTQVQKQQKADVSAQQAATQATQQVTTAQQTPQAEISSQQTITASISPTQQISQAQLSQTQTPQTAVSSVPQIMQQAEYEILGKPSSTIIPIPVGGSAPSKSMPGGTAILPIGMSKTQALNSYYQSQLIGFLYKQG